MSTAETASGMGRTYQADGRPVERVLLDPVPAAVLALLIPVRDDISPRQRSIQIGRGATRRLAKGIGWRGADWWWWLWRLWTRVVGVEEGTAERRGSSGTEERGGSDCAGRGSDCGDERYASGLVRATD